jgi:hypothetical protein
MAGHALNIDADFHTAPLAAVNAAIGRFRRYDEFRTDAVFFDDILPAKTIAIFFLDRTGNQDRIFIGQESQVFHDTGTIDSRYDATALVGCTAAADFRFRFKTFIRVKFPVILIANAYGIDMGIERDERLATAHVTQDIAHGIDFNFIEIESPHFLCDAVDMGLFIAAFAGILYDFP